MITIFNRRELTINFDIKKQVKARDLMTQNNIPYLIKIINRKGSSAFAGGRTGTFEANLQGRYEYVVYVKKSDYKQALAIINKKV